MTCCSENNCVKIPRHKMFLMAFLACVILYLFLLFGPISKILNKNILCLIRWSPFLAIVAFGVYAAYTIIRNVISLKNYPEEAESLLKDVAEAKEGLRKRGFKGDL